MKDYLEIIRLKIRNKIYLPLTYKKRQKKLSNNKFTIISNNCWSGTVYESYGLQKTSPTVGMYIMPEDYLKLVGNLQYYFAQPLNFINASESKWESVLQNNSNWGSYLIAKLDDIELQMLHYHDEKIAFEKWNSRIKRINYDKLIYKFNDQNFCTKQQIEEFMNLPIENKICFVSNKDYKFNSDVIFVKQPWFYRYGIKASREPFGKSKYIDLNKIINKLGEDK